jgi:hypothetical protein
MSVVVDGGSIPCTDEDWEAIKDWLHHGPPIVFPQTIEWIEEDGEVMGPVAITYGEPYFVSVGNGIIKHEPDQGG